jgi:hypothetical protein
LKFWGVAQYQVPPTSYAAAWNTRSSASTLPLSYEATEDDRMLVFDWTPTTMPSTANIASQIIWFAILLIESMLWNLWLQFIICDPTYTFLNSLMYCFLIPGSLLEYSILICAHVLCLFRLIQWCTDDKDSEPFMLCKQVQCLLLCGFE